MTETESLLREFRESLSRGQKIPCIKALRKLGFPEIKQAKGIVDVVFKVLDISVEADMLDVVHEKDMLYGMMVNLAKATERLTRRL